MIADRKLLADRAEPRRNPGRRSGAYSASASSVAEWRGPHRRLRRQYAEAHVRSSEPPGPGLGQGHDHAGRRAPGADFERPLQCAARLAASSQEQGSQSQLRAALRQCRDGLRELPAFDAVVLGMGDDGHTASFFPEATISPRRSILATSERIVTMRAPDAGEPRLTFTLKALARQSVHRTPHRRRRQDEGPRKSRDTWTCRPDADPCRACKRPIPSRSTGLHDRRIAMSLNATVASVTEDIVKRSRDRRAPLSRSH